MITVKDISVAKRLLPVSFQIKPGEKLHIIGPNGSGKSTLLAAMAGLLSYQGNVTIAEQDVADCDLKTLAKLRAYLPQADRPAFSMSVFHYLSLAIPEQADRALVENIVTEVTTLLSIKDKLTSSIHHLSGGEWQRVRLAAICLQAWPELNPQSRVMLLDEPAAPLDVSQESSLYKVVDLMAAKGLAIVIANHDLNRTLQHSDKVLVLKGGVAKAYGVTHEVLTESLISSTFDSQVIRIEHAGQPLLIFK